MADLGLNGKLVVITGSSSGIGKEIAEQFAAVGAHVVVNARSEGSIQKAISDIQVRSGRSRLGL